MTAASFRRVVVALSVLATAGALITPADASRPSPRLGTHTRVRIPVTTHTEGRIDAALRAAHGPVNVMLELTPTPAAVVTSRMSAATAALRLHRLDVFRSQRSRILTLQSSVASHFTQSATRASRLFAVNAAYDGIAVRTDASRLVALSHLNGVKAVHQLTPKKLDNTVTVPLIRAVQEWRDNGNTGTGVTIGVIDTGIDYTQADFGGAGGATQTDGHSAAYDTALAADTSAVSWPQGKVVGGTDLAGDSYDPSAGLPGDPDTNFNDAFPSPDPNPLDCNGHGTHVAGTAAGFGVTTGGATYTGSYPGALDDTTFENQFSVGPGVAPGASLYAIKIFGCGETGTATDLITQALDVAVAPDGDPNHHLDVVNMSLGSDYSPPDDPDAAAANDATLAGVTVVAASGNGGDLFNVGGAPGNAQNVIAVAASDDTQDVVDGLQVDSPLSAQDPSTPNNAWPAEESVAFAWAQRPAVQGDLARIGSGSFTAPSSSNNTDGCDPLNSTDATAVAGKVALLFWTDNDGSRRCGSATRTVNVANAGAIGAVFADDENQFTAGITGDASIPSMLTTQDAGTALLAALGSGTVTVTLTHALHNSVIVTHPGTVNQVASFSSRGVANAGLVKPDVTAPGVTVFSAAFGTGAQGVSFSGTSMATPHVAGEAALVLAGHPTWLTDAHTGDVFTNKGNVPLQVKAAIMNTATVDVTCTNPTATPSCVGVNESPQRVGAGRVDADAAATTQVIAYDTGAGNGVSVSFGRIDVPTGSPVTLHRTVRVANLGGSTVAAFTPSVSLTDQQPGVTITVTPKAALAPIPAGGTADYDVALTVDPSAGNMDKPDPTLVLNPTLPAGFPNFERSFIADTSGRIVFDNGTQTLRVPVYAAPRHVSTMHTPPTLALSNGKANLALSGDGFEDSQSGTTPDVSSVIDAFELQGVSGVLPACAGGVPPGCTNGSADMAADLRAVGAASDIPVYNEFAQDPYDPTSNSPDFAFPALGYIGIATQHPWRTPSDIDEYDVMFDVNGDGLPDAVLFNTRLPGTDIFVSQLDALVESRGGFVDGPTLDLEVLNNVDTAFTDMNDFDSSVLTLPFAVAALETVGFDPNTSTRVKYWVDSVSGESGIVDSIGDPLRNQTPMSFDLAHPALNTTDAADGSVFFPECAGLAVCSPDLNFDAPGVVLSTVETAASVAGDKPLGLMFLHHRNSGASQAQLVPFGTSIGVSLGRLTAPYGYRNPMTVTVRSAIGPPTGTVKVFEGTALLASGTLSGGVAHLILPVRPIGHHTMTVRYFGDVSHAASSLAVGFLLVVKATTATTLTVSGTGTTRTLTVVTRVVPPGASAIYGKLYFFDNGHLFARVVTRGKVAIKHTFSRGTHTVTVTFASSPILTVSTARRTFTV